MVVDAPLLLVVVGEVPLLLVVVAWTVVDMLLLVLAEEDLAVVTAVVEGVTWETLRIPFGLSVLSNIMWNENTYMRYKMSELGSLDTICFAVLT